eukprot:4858817-Amphidinium_carterae.1
MTSPRDRPAIGCRLALTPMSTRSANNCDRGPLWSNSSRNTPPTECSYKFISKHLKTVTVNGN